MRDKDAIFLLEKRVRELEQVTADCILEGDVRRLERNVAQYRKRSRMPVSRHVTVWPRTVRRSASFGWPEA